MRVSLYVNVRKYPEVCVARSLNMHVRVISQNSRRKDIAEDEGSNVLYVCTAPCNLWPGQKDVPCGKGTDQHVRLRSEMAL
jgi:hypothetical protein